MTYMTTHSECLVFKALN